MRIISRLRIVSLIALGQVLALAALLTWSVRDFNESAANSRLATEVRSSVVDTASLRDQYFLYREPRALVQWEREADLLKILLSKALATFEDPEQHRTLMALQANLQQRINIFQRIVANTDALQAHPRDRLFEELDKRLLSQLLLKAEETHALADTFEQSSQSQLRATFRRLIFVVGLGGLLLPASAAMILLLTGRRMRSRLAALMDGADRIAKGEFSFRIPGSGRDELEEVGHSINVMTDALQGFAVKLKDELTERIRQEAALRKSEAKFSALFEAIPDPVALVRLSDGSIRNASRSYAEYFGYEMNEVIGRSTLPGDLGIWMNVGQRDAWVARTKSGRTGGVGEELQLRRKDQSTVMALVSGTIVDMDGDHFALVNIHDISARKQYETELERIAHHDALTGLPNRLLLGDRLRQTLAQNQRSGHHVAICYLDLDGFKEANDEFGHAVGDAILIDVATRLRAVVRVGDTIARLGGDEFVVLLTALDEDRQCRPILERMLKILSAPYRVSDTVQARITASIGVTLHPADDADADTLIRHADHAMYIAKQAGKNRYQMFNPDPAEPAQTLIA